MTQQSLLSILLLSTTFAFSSTADAQCLKKLFWRKNSCQSRITSPFGSPRVCNSATNVEGWHQSVCSQDCASHHTFERPVPNVCGQICGGVACGACGGGDFVVGGTPVSAPVQSVREVLVPTLDDVAKREINDIKTKLDRIQLGDTPNINNLESQIKELRELIEKIANPESSSTSIGQGDFGLTTPRIWKDNTGKHSVSAELVKVNGDTIILKKMDGKCCQVPINRLSLADKDHVSKFVGSKKNQLTHLLANQQTLHQ